MNQESTYAIDWNTVPETLSKDQFYRLCHISKTAALHLLQSGKVT